jgi:hypothetical protein
MAADDLTFQLMKMTTEEAFVKVLQRTASNTPSGSSARP